MLARRQMQVPRLTRALLHHTKMGEPAPGHQRTARYPAGVTKRSAQNTHLIQASLCRFQLLDFMYGVVYASGRRADNKKTIWIDEGIRTKQAVEVHLAES